MFNGGELFRQCLESIVGKEYHFENIFISFNGEEDRIQSDLEIYRQSKIQHDFVKVLSTGVTLRPEEHNLFILNQLAKHGLTPNSMIMNLFHDDLLLTSKFAMEGGTDFVTIGRWKIIGDTTEKSAIGTQKVSPQTWLRKFKFHKAFTNGSGIIAPFHVFEDVAIELCKFRTGVRYEYLILTHESVQEIREKTSPLVSLRIHASQAGANVAFREYWRGEIMFTRWLFKNQRVRKLSDLAFIFFLLLALVKGSNKRLFANLKLYLKRI